MSAFGISQTFIERQEWGAKAAGVLDSDRLHSPKRLDS